MKVINTGNIYEVYDDSLRVFDTLPPQTYVVRCSQNKGFYMEKYVELEIKDRKIYGVHTEKADKVLSSYGKFDRNLGVILSGDKGIGKSLFAKLLSKKAIESGLPVIVVDRYVPGIASYLEAIRHEAVVLFDEFDKTFGEVSARDGEATPQTELLSMFDGISNGKKLFVITCNDLSKLNSYLINRPGRFHYHFRFDYPIDEDIRAYLTDNVREEFLDEIEKAVAFASRISLNFDCLRAISFELNNGTSFEEAISDLNILKVDREKFKLALHFKDGSKLVNEECIDMFDGPHRTYFTLKGEDEDFINVEFDPDDAEFDAVNGEYFISGDDFEWSYDSKKDEEKYEAVGISHISIRRIIRKDHMHYTVSNKTKQKGRR